MAADMKDCLFWLGLVGVCRGGAWRDLVTCNCQLTFCSSLLLEKRPTTAAAVFISLLRAESAMSDRGSPTPNPVGGNPLSPADDGQGDPGGGGGGRENGPMAGGGGGGGGGAGGLGRENGPTANPRMTDSPNKKVALSPPPSNQGKGTGI